MIKKIIFPLLTLLSWNMYAQVTFQKKLGNGADRGYSAKQTSDGGYIIAGYIYNPQTNYDFYLVKTDSLGNMLWTKYFATDGLDYGFCVIQASDGGYVICGQAPVVTNNYVSDVCLIKTDGNGNLMWTKTYGTSYWDYGYDVQQTNDGGYIIAAKTDGVGGQKVYVIKTDSNGNLVWDKVYGDGATTGGRSVKQTADGGYIICGYTHLGAGVSDVYLIRTDGNGDTLWTKTFGGSGEDVGVSVCRATGGGYIITGHTVSFGAGMKDVYLIKTDSTGNMLWSKTFGTANTDFGYDVQQTYDGGIIITGGTYGFTALVSMFLIKTNGSGNMLWSKIYGTGIEDFGFSVRQTTDGGYVLASSSSDGYFYLIKTDALGSSGCNESVPAIIEYAPATQTGTPATIVNTPATMTTLPSFIIGSGGIVKAICSNSCTSPSAKITSGGPTTFCSGDNVVLNAPPGANKTYQWQKGGVNIPGATSSAYSATIGGNYKVTVTNTVTGCFKTTSNATTVIVNPLPNATITPQGPTTFCAGGSVLLKANYGAGFTYQWKKGGNNISGATLKNYTASIAGVYKVKETNSSGCSKLSAGVTISVPCKEEEGLTSLTGFNVSIFPNPVHSEINIVLPGNDNFEIEIVNILGDEILTLHNQNRIDISELRSGVYFIKVICKEQIVIQKFIKE